MTFLIADGVYPSNTDRGYVLRFLIRRAIRNGRLLGYPARVHDRRSSPAVVASLESGYPELRARLGDVAAGAATRRKRTFVRTLERGMAMLDALIDDAAKTATHDLRRAKTFHAARHVRLSDRADARDRRSESGVDRRCRSASSAKMTRAARTRARRRGGEARGGRA